MIQQPHPDEPLTQQAIKNIKRGALQAADDRAMEAMWQALESGMSKEEAERIFSNTYKKMLSHGK